MYYSSLSIKSFAGIKVSKDQDCETNKKFSARRKKSEVMKLDKNFYQRDSKLSTQGTKNLLPKGQKTFQTTSFEVIYGKSGAQLIHAHITRSASITHPM